MRIFNVFLCLFAHVKNRAVFARTQDILGRTSTLLNQEQSQRFTPDAGSLDNVDIGSTIARSELRGQRSPQSAFGIILAFSDGSFYTPRRLRKKMYERNILVNDGTRLTRFLPPQWCFATETRYRLNSKLHEATYGWGRYLNGTGMIAGDCCTE